MNPLIVTTILGAKCPFADPPPPERPRNRSSSGRLSADAVMAPAFVAGVGEAFWLRRDIEVVDEGLTRRGGGVIANRLLSLPAVESRDQK